LLLGRDRRFAQDISGTHHPLGGISTRANTPSAWAFKKFAEVLKEKSGGKLKIQSFRTSQLGSETQQQSALRGGHKEMFSSSTSSLAGIVKEDGIFDSRSTSTRRSSRTHQSTGRWARHCSQAARQGSDRSGLLGPRFRQVTNSRRPIATGRTSTA